MFVLFAFLISIGLLFVDMFVGTYDETLGIGLLEGLFSLAMLIPSLAVAARRLHDTGKSGWLQLLFLIPIAGLILWIIWMAKEGDDGMNKYGPSPKDTAGYPPGGPALA